MIISHNCSHKRSFFPLCPTLNATTHCFTTTQWTNAPCCVLGSQTKQASTRAAGTVGAHSYGAPVCWWALLAGVWGVEKRSTRECTLEWMCTGSGFYRICNYACNLLTIGVHRFTSITQCNSLCSFKTFWV